MPVTEPCGDPFGHHFQHPKQDDNTLDRGGGREGPGSGGDYQGTPRKLASRLRTEHPNRRPSHRLPVVSTSGTDSVAVTSTKCQHESHSL